MAYALKKAAAKSNVRSAMIAVRLICDDYLNQSTRTKHRGRSNDLSTAW